jgi:hypothetical protein
MPSSTSILHCMHPLLQLQQPTHQLASSQLISATHQGQWLLNTPTAWTNLSAPPCSKLRKSCTTYFRWRASRAASSCLTPNIARLTGSIGANEVLTGLKTTESKAGYLIHIIAVELYKASKSIDATVCYPNISICNSC